VALGEGLETQFWRLDNGQVRWLTVDLPETMELRHRLLPDGSRQCSYSGSALDLRWLDRLNPAAPILVTAQGLLPYFHRDQVHALIAGIAERLPGSLLVFDGVPEVVLKMVREPRAGSAISRWSCGHGSSTRTNAPPSARSAASRGFATSPHRSSATLHHWGSPSLPDFPGACATRCRWSKCWKRDFRRSPRARSPSETRFFNSVSPATAQYRFSTKAHSRSRLRLRVLGRSRRSLRRSRASTPRPVGRRSCIGTRSRWTTVRTTARLAHCATDESQVLAEGFKLRTSRRARP
jgi:Leucine carboxyl methyltransferase